MTIYHRVKVNIKGDKMNRPEEIESLKEQLSELGDRIEEMSGADIKQKAREYAQTVRQGLRGAYEKGVQAKESVNTYSHEHPWIIAGAALGVGLIIGMLSRPCKCKKYD